MDFNRKILIVLIIFIFIYIILRLVIKRIEIKNEIEGYENVNVNTVQNGYDCAVTIKNDLKIRLKNVQDNINSNVFLSEALYLRNYAIKASMNSAYNGKETSTDMINYVLSRGCRFLDFEVYIYRSKDVNENEVINTVVSVTKNKDSDFLPLDNVLTVSEALYYTNMYAFNTTCPNYGDPLFIQLRPKIINNSEFDNNKKSISSNINQAISENLSELYKGKVTSQTPLPDLLGKIIIVMDDKQFPDCNQLINMSSNAILDKSSNSDSDMKTFSYGKILPIQQRLLNLKSDSYTCNTNSITQVIFEDASYVSYTTNVNMNILFQSYSSQIIPMMFWNTGGELCNYESLFNKCGGGIVPLSFIYEELKKVDNKYIEYPNPLFAFSNYGSQTTTLFILVACLGIVGFIVVRELK